MKTDLPNVALATTVDISFVLPAFNEEEHIGACIESVLREMDASSARCEIIVVNNASTDRTGATASRYPRVRVVDEPRKGLSQARNTGYRHASGWLIANIDTDCRLPKGWLKRALSSFAVREDLVALSGPAIYDDLPRLTQLLIRAWYLVLRAWLWLQRQWTKKAGMIVGANTVVRKTALDQIGGYDTSINFYGEDVDLGRKLDAIGLVRFDFSFSIFTSGRRFAKEGLLRTAIRYTMNYLRGRLYGKHFTESHADIRS